MTFPLFTLDSAPAASRPALADLQDAFGFLPNVAASMAGAPTLITAFVAVFQKVHGGTLSEAQIQILLLTNAVTNHCTWAVAFHSALALQQGVGPDDVQAIRERRLPADRQFAALSALARRLIEQRGHLEPSDLDGFGTVGFDPAQVLEVILVSAASTITNYAANVTRPALEAPFAAQAWRS